MSDHIEFVFLEPTQKYASHMGGVVVQNVKDMVARVLFELAQSRGKIGKIIFESPTSWGSGTPGFFYIGLDEISPVTIKQHALDLVMLAPHFAPDAQVKIYAPCGSAFNVMTTYLLSNYWPGVSVKTENSARCGGYGRSPSLHHGHGYGHRSRSHGGRQGDYFYRGGYGHGHSHGRHY